MQYVVDIKYTNNDKWQSYFWCWTLPVKLKHKYFIININALLISSHF